MSKIRIHTEGNNGLGTYIEIDGVKLCHVSKVSFAMLPRCKPMLTVDLLASDENGKPVIFDDEFVNLNKHYAIDLGDLELSGVKLVPKEDA